MNGHESTGRATAALTPNRAGEVWCPLSAARVRSGIGEVRAAGGDAGNGHHTYKRRVTAWTC